MTNAVFTCARTNARKVSLTLSALLLAALSALGAGTTSDEAVRGCPRIDLAKIPDVRLFRGTPTSAYRDPAVVFADGTFHLFMTWVFARDDQVQATVVQSDSQDLVHWTKPKALFPSDPNLNYSSPGNVVRDGDAWVMCFQTYPRPGARLSDIPPRYGNADCRLYVSRTRDFRVWSPPELLKVKGPDTSFADMGRMIDPYLVKAPDGLWHCFFKQNGVSFSTSRDLKTWTFRGRADAGENVCVIPADGGGWLMMHSPWNGLALKRSSDLLTWTDVPGLITLGQKDWPWAKGRLTAGAILDARKLAGIGRYLLFFHGSGPKTEEAGDFDRNASVGIAWSEDLVNWEWPGKCAAPVRAGVFEEHAEVDVLVAGGTEAAVEAAVAAQRAGWRTLLVSPRPYLGEDTAGRFELKPVPVTDEPLAVSTNFTYSADRVRGRVAFNFPRLTRVTRIEVVTFEQGGCKPFRTAECHFIFTKDGKTFSSARPLQLAMNYSPMGEYVWRAELDEDVRGLAVGATRRKDAANFDVRAVRVFRAADPGTRRRPTPLEEKVRLDRKLVEAGVPFVTGAMGVDVLVESSGRVAGAVFATREGLKRVRAGQVVDASVHGVLLKAAGGRLTPLPKRLRLSRVVLSLTPPVGDGLTVEDLGVACSSAIQIRGRAPEPVAGRLYRCSFDWATDDTPAGWASVEMRARALTWSPDLLDAAEELAFAPQTCEKAVPGLVYLPVGATGPLNLNPKKTVGDVRPAGADRAVLTSCDVCVAGAGTAGAPAAIAAARAGARTVAVEYAYGMGGLGTLGMIGYYWYGTVCGFTAEVENGIATLGARVPGVGKREWWRREAEKAGARVLFGSLAYGVTSASNRVIGVCVATPFGAGVVRAAVAVDATGAADLAAAAGERTEFVTDEELALQTAGQAPRRPGFTYVNTDFGYVNDNDVSDASLFARRARQGATGEWDVSPIVGSRERRRLVGALQVQPEDVLNERRFEDTIATGKTDFDTHGPTVADVCFLSPVTTQHVFRLNIPYRALLPATVDGLLVCGLGASGHRDAMPFMRMQADVQNEGYAAGRAAAMAVKAGCAPRRIDVRELQRHLAAIGSIPRAALDWKDNFPLSEADWQKALATAADGFVGVPWLLTDRVRARRDLADCFRTETDAKRRLCLAQTLGMLGDGVGADLLAENLRRPRASFDPVVPESAKRFGKRLSNRDAQLVALGRTRTETAVAVIADELRTIRKNLSFEHVRALSLAGEALADARLAPLFAAALRLPRVGGNAVSRAEDLAGLGGFTGGPGCLERMRCVRELLLARALVACGDHDGLGVRTLRAFAADPRGVYAANARAFLSARLLFPRSDVKAAGVCKARVAARGAAYDVTAAALQPWSGLALTLARPVDLTAVARVIAVVSNRTDRPLTLNMDLKTPGVPTQPLHARATLAPFAAGELVADIAGAPTRAADFEIPGLRGYEAPRGAKLDIARIGVIHFYCSNEPRPAAFTVTSVRVAGTAERPARLEKADGFFPFVDRFGQFVHATWPGKVRSESDIRAREADEAKDLAAHPAVAIPDADRFGGWAKGPQLRATGAFRTEKVDGRWHLVDPDGHLFFSLGVNCVQSPDTTGVTGRESFFGWLPARTDATFGSCWGRQKGASVRGFYATHFPSETFNFARANLIRKYGRKDWRTRTTDQTLRRLKSWGLTTIANWSVRDPAVRAQVPYTDTFTTRARPIRGNQGFWRKFPDVFAPEFESNVVAAAQTTAARSGRDPWCLGWFVDNELSWGADDTALAREVLVSPDDQPAKVVFLRTLRTKGIATNAVPRAELAAFTRTFAARYFSVVRAAIRQAAPDRLYLGCRFAWAPPVVLACSADYCDVVTANLYRDDPTSFRLPDGAVDKPLLSGEFHFGALDRGLLHTGLVPTVSQEERAARFKRYVRAALADPRFVGVHWFKWGDQPLTGRFDGECFQVGLVDVADTPYPEMVAALRELARELYVQK